MSNFSSIYVCHPLEDFRKEDQEYFLQYQEAQKQAKKYWVKDSKKKGAKIWKGPKRYDEVVADLLQLPPLDPNDKKHWSRIKMHAHIVESQDGELLVYPYGSDRIALGRMLIDFSKDGRNTVPDFWRIACMTAEVEAGCTHATENDMYCYAFNRITLPDAIHNTMRYLNAAYQLPVSDRFGIWIPFARFCGHIEDFGEWLALHSLLSINPEKCLVVLDWSEVSLFYADDAEMKKAANNEHIVEMVNKLEHVTTKKESLGILFDDPNNITPRKADLYSWAKASHPFIRFRSTQPNVEI